jgi:hypothetical protein
MEQSIHTATQHPPWNKGKLAGQKAPLAQRQTARRTELKMLTPLII